MPVIGGGIAVGGLFDFGGAKKQASAMRDAAQMQLTASRESIAAQEKAQAYAVSLAEATPQELGMIGQQISVQSQNLNTQMNRLNSEYEQLQKAQPIVQESGKQVLQLLQGEQAAILAPMKNERERQRSVLVNQLKNQLGSGYATSSVGQQALLQFDLQSQDLTVQAQNQTLQNMANVYLGTQGQYANIASTIGSNQTTLANSFLATPLQAMQNLTGRKVAAATGNAPNYGQLVSGTQGFMQAAQGAGAGLQSIGQTFGTAASVWNTQNQTDKLIASQKETLQSIFGNRPTFDTASSALLPTGG